MTKVKAKKKTSKKKTASRSEHPLHSLEKQTGLTKHQAVVTKYKRSATTFLAQAEKLKVTNTKQEEIAYAVRTKIAIEHKKLETILRGLTDKQVEIRRIALGAKRDLENFFAPPLATLQDSLNAIDRKLLDYKNKLEEEAAAAEEEHLEAVEELEEQIAEAEEDGKGIRAGRLNKKLDELNAMPAFVPPPVATQTRNLPWNYRLVDIKLVPAKYKEEVLKKGDIWRDIQAGERDIPGLEIFQPESVS